MVSDEQLEKLPKYARDEIIALRRDKADLQQEIRAMRQDKPSRVKWGWGMSEDEAYGYLRDSETVAFTTAKGDRSIIRVRLKEGSLNIMANGELLIHCQSSNCFDLTVKE
jgi:hypothetical protein